MDPIQLVLAAGGFGAKKAIEAFIKRSFAPSLSRDLANDVGAWAEALPSDLWVQPESLFLYDVRPHEREGRTALLALAVRFAKRVAPTNSQWRHALEEQWRHVRKGEKADLQPF